MPRKAKLGAKLSALQSKADRKVKYLVSKGASVYQINEYTSYLTRPEVEQMNRRERYNYYRRLQTFVNTDYVVLQSHEVVEKVVLTRTQKYMAQYNERAARLRKQVNARTEGTGLRDRFGTVEQYTSSVAGDLRLNGNRVGGTFVTGRISPLVMGKLPTTRANALKREEAFKRMASESADSRRRKAVRDSAVKMLLMNGDTETARRIRAMSNERFDVLSLNTNFFDVLKSEYDPDSYSDYEKMKGMSSAELFQYRTELGFSTGNPELNDIIDLVNQEIPRS